MIKGLISFAKVTKYIYKIVNTFPHEQNAFTQGLVYKDGYLYEGTGLKGYSSLRQTELETGEIVKQNRLPRKYFGEGITIFKGKIFQLTWKSGICFVYNKDFKLIKKFKYPYQGWGITQNNNSLIMSDGTDNIYFLNPDNFERYKKIKITLNNKSITNINELEYIKGEIYANIWRTNYIVKINPDTGNVTAIIDLNGIINPNDYDYNLNVLNGIAYDGVNNRLFITGKLWPLIFEIEIISLNK
ncbi:glutaminyl-peptide cyclotransferase [Selenihalanaerobacter shriftii]|uniref:Glutamine cyclotransferase n=1 Tax=Selenihalanaerobacter shriftii TaxID=142842 RepID=A0A1T4PVX5_9FIRM|nr:glutaminyl-peptide cyclotransferase [Selenihalanaerobacter shriftii]SJZ95447.1 Glutamine cyclotransferase [Selenihalanaerobacter shriftii]